MIGGVCSEEGVLGEGARRLSMDRSASGGLHRLSSTSLGAAGYPAGRSLLGHIAEDASTTGSAGAGLLASACCIIVAARLHHHLFSLPRPNLPCTVGTNYTLPTLRVSATPKQPHDCACGRQTSPYTLRLCRNSCREPVSRYSSDLREVLTE